MGWITLSLRKLTLKAQINDLELQDIKLSRQLRTLHRHLSYDQSVFNNDKKAELSDAKKEYDELRKERQNYQVGTPEYDEWQKRFSDVKEDYEAEKLEINDYYDDILTELEEESTEEETRIQQEQAEIEAQLESSRQELEAINEQISNDIQNSKINLK